MFYPLIVLALVAYSLEADCARIPDTTRISPVGRFSDMRFTEEHAYGHSIELWRAGTCLFGLLQVSEGLAGDTPTGEVAGVRYDPRTGDLAFTAKLTTGVTRDQASKRWVPTRDLFGFRGQLKAKVLEGKLRRSDQLRAQPGPIEERVVLRLDPEQQAFMIEAVTYGEWRKKVEPILQYRGPKW
jgi:hypothetical protein